MVAITNAIALPLSIWIVLSLRIGGVPRDIAEAKTRMEYEELQMRKKTHEFTMKAREEAFAKNQAQAAELEKMQMLTGQQKPNRYGRLMNPEM